MATRGSIAPRGSVAIAQSKQGVGTPQFASYDERAAASGGQVLYGLDKELAEKAAAKYDVGMEHKCREWIEAVTGDKLGESTLQEELKNGVVLCNLINAIKPGLINKSANPNPNPSPNPNPNPNANPNPNPNPNPDQAEEQQDAVHADGEHRDVPRGLHEAGRPLVLLVPDGLALREQGHGRRPPKHRRARQRGAEG